jgi:hypothetical protein
MITYTVCLLDQVIDQLKDKFYSHASETELYQEFMPLNPDYDAYFSLSDAGSLYFVVMVLLKECLI